MNFTPLDIENYSSMYTSDATELLYEIESYTKAEVAMPRMLCSHLQGRVLALLSRLVRPYHILEIGTYTGYSALCLCEGLPPEGRLTTLDINEEISPRVQQFFNTSPWASQITYTIGNATLLIPNIDGPFDLVFIDADKTNYTLYYQLVIDKLRSGGLLIADNVLWSGKVTDLSRYDDKDTCSLHTFNAKVQSDPKVEQVLLPIRDGLMLVRKK